MAMNRIVHTHFLARAFPIPRSLVLSNTAVDICDGVMRFFSRDQKHGMFIPRDFGTLAFPRLHTSQNDKVKEEAVTILGNWAHARGQKIVNAIIHEDEAYVFKVSVPTSDRSQIRSAIEALLEENVPIPPSDAIFEYTIVARDEKLHESTVAVTALSRASVNEYLDIFKKSGLTVASLDTEARAMAKALFTKDDTNVHAVLAIAERHSVVFIAERGAVVFSSSIEVGSRDFDKAIAKTLNITEDAARTLKHEQAITPAKDEANLFEATLSVSSTIRDELAKVLAYWKAQGKKEREFVDVSEIILLGSDSVNAGFAQYISATSKIPCRIGSVWTNTEGPDKTLPTLHHNDSLDYGSVIGTLI